jgi:hypothetical protein
MGIKQNDEWDYADALGHYDLVRNMGHRLLACQPPYVVGICGSWGAGKTSFLRKLWAYLDGKIEWDDGTVATISKKGERQAWFKEDEKAFKVHARGKKLELVWFNPWQHQFESSPLVALLNEIRQYFSLKRKLLNEVGKLGDVAVHATLNSMSEFAKDLTMPLPSAKAIMERGQEYESEHFSSALGSQRFREFFEAAIESITGERGLLVIFIDDLDRCEGETSYRLLEALKLYLNAKNCIYMLGLDQQHLENSIARVLSGEKETWRYRPLARDYLGKMLQTTFPLPVPRNASAYISMLLNKDDLGFHDQLRQLFGLNINGFVDDDWPKVVETLDFNLPHNPRKLKSFVASWKIYITMLSKLAAEDLLDWRLTLILHYLAHFEEPLYRRIEQFPNFYNQHLVPYCQQLSRRPHSLFDGLEIPSDEAVTFFASATEMESGALGSPPVMPTADPEREEQPLPEPRFFWISRLIRELAQKQRLIDASVLRRHMPQPSVK